MKPIRILSPNLDLLAEIDDYNSMFFTRRWHGIGDIEIRINRYKQHTDLLQKDNILLIGSDIHKVFVIKHREIELDENGRSSENWIIRGPSLKSVIGQRITVPPVGLSHDAVTGHAESVIKHYVNSNVISPVDTNRSMNNMILVSDLARGGTLSKQSRYKNLADEVVDLSLTSGLGWDVYLDVQQKKWIFDVVEGRDLTIDQSILPPVIFSPHFDSLKSLNYTDSKLNYKNTAYVGGAGEGELRRIVEVGSSIGLDRHEIFIDARDVRETDDNSQPIPEAQIIQSLTERGLQQLEKFIQEQYLEGQILTKSPFKYETDYDLGDIITVQSRDWNVTMNARITEIKEIYEAGGPIIEAIFGNDRPTLIDKIKQEFNQINAEVRK